MDIKSASLPDLRRLAVKIEKEIERREKNGKQELLKKLKKLAEDQGFDFASLVGLEEGESKPVKQSGRKSGKTVKAPKKSGGQIKFRHPEDASIGWTGHGRKPGWVIQWLDVGKTMDELAVGYEPPGVEKFDQVS